MAVPAEKLFMPQAVQRRKKVKSMGDKSPKSTQKKSKQVKAKAAAKKK